MTNHAEPVPVPPEPSAGPAPLTATLTAAAGAPGAAAPRASVVRQALRDTGYLLPGLPLTIVTFTLAFTGMSLAAGLLVTVVGIFVAAGTLYATTGFGHLERARLAARGTELAPIVFLPRSGSGFRRALVPLRDPRRWATLLHALGALPLTTVTWSAAVVWWAGALGGLTYWFWERWLGNPDSNTTLAELLRLPVSESVLNFVLGVVFALTLPAVLRACAEAHATWARLLLTGASRAALEAEVRQMSDRRAAAASAEAHSLRRLERDLHDGPQQRLVRLAMDLSVAERRLAQDPDAARDLLGAAREQAAETLAEIRALSRGIAPPVLADRGLAAAVSAVAARSTVQVVVDVALPDGSRPSPSTENAAYFVVTEALANVAKHARATRAEVRVALVDGAEASASGEDAVGARRVVIEVHDDGVGGASLAKGHGLAGLADRVQGLGGTLAVSSPEGGPTVVTATLPWA